MIKSGDRLLQREWQNLAGSNSEHRSHDRRQKAQLGQRRMTKTMILILLHLKLRRRFLIIRKKNNYRRNQCQRKLRQVIAARLTSMSGMRLECLLRCPQLLDIHEWRRIVARRARRKAGRLRKGLCQASWIVTACIRSLTVAVAAPLTICGGLAC
jgi:hypothetical protein